MLTRKVSVHSLTKHTQQNPGSCTTIRTLLSTLGPIKYYLVYEINVKYSKYIRLKICMLYVLLPDYSAKSQIVSSAGYFMHSERN